MSEWQPIDTCPKHVDVLFYREDAGVFFGQYTYCGDWLTDEQCEEMGDSAWEEDFWAFDYDGVSRCDGDLKPTMWMIPVPPSASAAHINDAQLDRAVGLLNAWERVGEGRIEAVFIHGKTKAFLATMKEPTPPQAAESERNERCSTSPNTTTPTSGIDQKTSDWFAGDVDCDGNELVTMRAGELQKLKDDREKFMWQVRDTCVRAEKAEAALAALTPPQAAESGLLDEAVAVLREIRDSMTGKPVGGGDGGTYTMTMPSVAALRKMNAFLAKAGKPGEAGNG